jgi:hypothetical protein
MSGSLPLLAHPFQDLVVMGKCQFFDSNAFDLSRPFRRGSSASNLVVASESV